MNARSFIDSLDFASNQREISGEVPVSELRRLQDLLENQQGKLAYRIRGSVDDQGNHYLDVSLTGRCQVRCQRCLDVMDYPVQLESRLILRDQESLDAEELLMEQLAIPLGHQKTTAKCLVMAGQPGHEQEYDSILADDHLDVLSLLEDEILLGLPIAPRHEQAACQVAGGGNMHQEGSRPFAALANLKRN